jgi:enamine deaminase RidA (YjgF/YER057c/UK114 family)
MSQTILPPGWKQPRGYSNGMRARGELLAIAGQVGWDENARLVSPEFLPQFERALENVVTVVRAAGGEPEHIVSMTIYVIDRADYLGPIAEVGEIYRKVMGKHYPTMALLVVAGLVDPAARVEIQALAVLP